MEGYFYSINKDLFSFSFINDTNERHDWEDRDNWSHYPILHRVLNFMKERGFEVGRDPRIMKYYECLNKDRWYGKKDGLEFKAERYPRGWRIEFYQSINFENKNGGEYDFDKFEKAPYLIRLRWIVETKKMAEFIESIVPGIKNSSKIDYKLAEDKIKNYYVEEWHHSQKDMNFDLSSLDGLEGDEEYRRRNYQHNCKDRDKKVIVNGLIKYFYGYKGRLQRGKVYHNINNMWWVILNDTDYTNIASFELFDPAPEDFKRRRIQKNKKQSYETSREAARKYFTKKGLTYNDIKRKDIEKLNEIVGEEIIKCAANKECLEIMRINDKIKTKCKTNSKIIRAFLYVDAHYFAKRESISFNEDGFIGFAGWAGDSNVRPMLLGFYKWCDWVAVEKLKDTKKGIKKVTNL